MWIIIGIIVGVVLIVVMFNRLIALKQRVRNAWHQIDVQLKRRYDLIPNLVETVKGYTKHEKEIFETITRLRSEAISAKGIRDTAEKNNQLTKALKTLFAVVENYPDLKASQNFLSLQEELTSTENKIAFARQFYNDVTMQYNTKIHQFPWNILARILGFREEEYYEIEEEIRRPVRVSF